MRAAPPPFSGQRGDFDAGMLEAHRRYEEARLIQDYGGERKAGLDDQAALNRKQQWKVAFDRRRGYLLSQVETKSTR